jgi:hypothetical protein
VSFILNYIKLERKFIIILVFPIILSAYLFSKPGIDTYEWQFSSENPNILLSYTSIFLHGYNSHLIGNLIVYFFILIGNNILFSINYDMDAFYNYSLLIFLIFPPIHSLIWNYFIHLIADRFIGAIGLSSIISCYIALAISYWIFFVVKRFNTNINSAYLFLFTITIIAIIVNLIYPNYGHVYIITPILIIIMLFFGYHPIKNLYSYFRKTKSIELYLSFGLFFLYLLMIPAMFPAIIARDGVVTNIISHLLGLFFGLTLPMIDRFIRTLAPI